MDRQEILAELLRQHLEAGTGLTDDGSLARLGTAGVEGVALGLVAASNLPPGELSRARASLEPVLEDLGLLKRRRAVLQRLEAVPTMSVIRESENTSADKPVHGHPTPAQQLPMLLRVQSLAGEEISIGGQPAVLVSLELWSMSMRLRLAYPNLRRPAAEILRRHRPWRAWDDAGTQYRERGSETSDTGGILVESRVFDATAPAEAALLTVTAEHEAGADQFTVPLRPNSSEHHSPR
ncbi:hypothetical protein [Micromonospora sp. WMMD1082]|uniref:hypothetical protein n=1 Tax=Micromonospora sp. WMMD1082 TaxID=3016104 RepID=UPI002415D863|nr:hypothetical protein [Micromonospora sp. WMMD1082]MDG4796922.1 hypothetical protein [Micromonospora sp. WMMD1082]